MWAIMHYAAISCSMPSPDPRRYSRGVSGDSDLVAAIRAALQDHGDPARAPQMQAYMKSAMPYLGVRVPEVRAITRAAARQWKPASLEHLGEAVRQLWHGAAYREERYAATALLGAPGVQPLLTPGSLALCRELIVDGAWWDHVDDLAHRVGDLLRRFPREVEPTVRAWQHDGDHWLRRVSIICQLGAGARTDRALLADAVRASAGEQDFFLRKAIGWALRDYARTDPQWVRAFVAEHELSRLSVREALKRL
jgi:3-methyladenine DNA glycosylase AlkD